MATRKHPILMGLIGLAVIFFVFLIFVFIISLFLGGEQELTLSDKIAVVPITGVITDSRTIIEDLRRFKNQSKVKAIVLRIDSPGGAVGPSQEIYQELKKISAVKPVITSIGSMAASGGYYVACASNKIVANPGAITGSIGVVLEYANVKELMEKIGLQGVVIKSGKYKDIMSPIRDMTNEERKVLQTVIDDIHSQFVAAVAQGRNLERSEVESIADGRIFTGFQAQALGLVDSLGTLYDAVDVAAQMVGLEGTPELVYPKKRGSFIERMVGEAVHHYEQLLCIPYRFSYVLAP